MIETDVPVVAVRSASRRFRTSAGPLTAVDDVSFEILAGETIGLAGPSGSGKTTLLNLIVGWERPDAGRSTGVQSTVAGSPSRWFRRSWVSCPS